MKYIHLVFLFFPILPYAQTVRTATLEDYCITGKDVCGTYEAKRWRDEVEPYQCENPYLMIDARDISKFIPEDVRNGTKTEPVIFACSKDDHFFKIQIDYIYPQPQDCPYEEDKPYESFYTTVWADGKFYDKRILTKGCYASSQHKRKLTYWPE